MKGVGGTHLARGVHRVNAAARWAHLLSTHFISAVDLSRVPAGWRECREEF